MKIRFGLVSALVAGSLALAPGLSGCSSSSSNDAGTTTDSGPDAGDAGNQTPDAGPDAGDGGLTVDPHGLGMACTPGDGKEDNCSRNLVCENYEAGNLCTVVNCAAEFLPDAGTMPTNLCGQTEAGDSNICLTFSDTVSACVRGCTPSVSGSCDRADDSCWTEPDNSSSSCTQDSDCGGDFCIAGSCSVAFCWFDCNHAGLDYQCGYGSSCTTGGQCNSTSCDSSTPCPTGQLCWTDTSQSPPASSCVPNCTGAVDGGANACPAAYTCDPMVTAADGGTTGSGTCNPIVHTFGETCGGATAACDASSICLLLSQSGTVGLCLNTCTSDTDCADGATCSIGLTNGETVCTPIPCGATDGGTTSDAGASDAGTVPCPTGTACGTIQVSQTAQIQACLPVQN